MLLLLERVVDVVADPPLIARCFSLPGVSGGEERSAPAAAVDAAADDAAIETPTPVSLSDSERKRPAVGAAIAFCPVFNEVKCLAGGTLANAL